MTQLMHAWMHECADIQRCQTLFITCECYTMGFHENLFQFYNSKHHAGIYCSCFFFFKIAMYICTAIVTSGLLIAICI